MSVQSARIAPTASPQAGLGIDRDRPIRFTLDGQDFSAFAGDTVLSALLAAGVDTIGSFAGHKLALDARFAPALVPARFAGLPEAAVPMARLPATDKAELVTPGRSLSALGPLAGLRQLFGGPQRSLGLRFDRAGEFVEPWRSAAASQTLTTDVLVVGGGVAGMSAAVAAAEGNARVMLVERRPFLGGDAPFYGAVEDEEPPDAMIERLLREVAARPNISVLLFTEAVGMSGGVVALHGLTGTGSDCRGVRIDVAAAAVVLATGAFERLPVFPGNRHPGVVGAIAAYHDFRRFGLWPGASATFSTQGNFAYRLGLHVADAGIAIRRIADTRVRPQSRFIDFCKASGITLAAGLVPHAVTAAPRGTGLLVGFSVAIEDIDQEAGVIATDRLVVAGGWQPDLTLWCRAGGGSVWNRGSGRLEPRGSLAGVQLAGSAAGLRNTGACAQSGRAAAARMRGEPSPVIDDTQIDALYETPDDATPMGPVTAAKAGPAFLDAGPTLLARPDAAAQGLVARLLARRSTSWAPLDEGYALGLCDLVAALQIGVLDRRTAGVLARERCVAPAQIDTGHAPLARVPAAPTLPAFLAGRFGPKTALWIVLSDDSRFFDIGCLVFADPADTDPALAIGVIVAPAPGRRSGGLALLGKVTATPGERVTVRDENGPVLVRLMDRFGLDAPLPGR